MEHPFFGLVQWGYKLVTSLSFLIWFGTPSHGCWLQGGSWSTTSAAALTSALVAPSRCGSSGWPTGVRQVDRSSWRGSCHPYFPSFSINDNRVWPGTTIRGDFPQHTASSAHAGTWPNLLPYPRDTDTIPADLSGSLRLCPSAGRGRLGAKTRRSSLSAADVTSAWRENKVG